MEFHDFNSDEEFNLLEEYSNLNMKKIDTPDEQKVTDAETIITDLGNKYVDGSSLDKYEALYGSLNAFLIKYKTENKSVISMTRNERDKLFGYSVSMYKEYENIYQNLLFNFELSQDEWHFIENVLNKKMKYNGQELFNYWQLRVDFLDPTAEKFKKVPKEIPSLVLTTSVKNMILLSHLLMTHEETGNTKSFYHFKNILLEIASMTKLFNAYGVMSERLSKKFSEWVNALNAIDGYNDETVRMSEILESETSVKIEVGDTKEETIKGEVLSPE